MMQKIAIALAAAVMATGGLTLDASAALTRPAAAWWEMARSMKRERFHIGFTGPTAPDSAWRHLRRRIRSSSLAPPGPGLDMAAPTAPPPLAYIGALTGTPGPGLAMADPL
jgi:hypothetical protein